MSGDRSSYRQIVKATSIFGGVQAYNIALGLVRNKLLAVLLGPAGMGLSGLLTSTTAMVASLTDLGLTASAVRDVAAAHAANDSKQLAITATVLRRLVWLSGLLGAGLTAALSPWLSEFAFGNRNYTWSFAAIAVTLLLTQLAASRNVLLQGTRRLGDLAKLNVAGGTAGLLVSLPLYIWLGQDGIVPAIVASSATALAVAVWYGRRVTVEPVSVGSTQTWQLGRTMIALGIALSFSGLTSTASAYLLRVYLTSHGSLENVGLYSAGFGVMNTYVGMIFNAMVADYYPRLSAAMREGEEWRQIVNQQASFSVLVLAPLMCAFIVFIRPAIVALYSSRFLAADEMMRWAALGVLIKVVAWPVGFLFIPKGNARLFAISETAANAYMLGLSVAGFAWRGLSGLGMAFALGYALYLLQMVALAHKVYDFRYDATIWRLSTVQLALAIGCTLAVQSLPGWPAYLLGCAIVAASATLSFVELDKRLDLRQALAKVRARFR